MTGQTNAHARAHHDLSSTGAELFWRIANPIMAGLIGFYWANATGAVVGASLAIALPFLPAALKQVFPVLRKAMRWAAPHIETAWGRLLAYLPLSLVRVIERRRS
jgi:hypothetical protein